MPPKGTKKVYRVTRMFSREIDGESVMVTNANVNDVAGKLDKGDRETLLERGTLVESFVPKEDVPAAAREEG